MWCLPLSPASWRACMQHEGLMGRAETSRLSKPRSGLLAGHSTPTQAHGQAVPCSGKLCQRLACCKAEWSSSSDLPPGWRHHIRAHLCLQALHLCFQAVLGRRQQLADGVVVPRACAGALLRGGRACQAFQARAGSSEADQAGGVQLQASQRGGILPGQQRSCSLCWCGRLRAGSTNVLAVQQLSLDAEK